MKSNNKLPKHLKKCKQVHAESVGDYLNRYYKPDRYRGRGEKYEKELLKSYKEELKEKGYVITSHYDNVLGVFIYCVF